VLALVALAAFWVVTGIVLHRTWPVAVGAVFVIALVVKLVQAGANEARHRVVSAREGKPARLGQCSRMTLRLASAYLRFMNNHERGHLAAGRARDCG
jgi:hypothetical protein